MTARSNLAGPAERLTRLAYELLDAHYDTLQLGAVARDDGGRGWLDQLRWQAHLDYLRALQRTARELLAGVLAGAPAHAPADRSPLDAAEDSPEPSR